MDFQEQKNALFFNGHSKIVKDFVDKVWAFCAYVDLLPTEFCAFRR